MRYPVVLLIVLIALSTQAAGEDAAGPETALPVAFALPSLAAISAVQSRAMVVEAVYQATALSGGASHGRVVNTGTLHAGPAGVQYLPTPADRLVVNLGGQRHEFVVHQAQGNNQAATATAWLYSPHNLHYSHRMAGAEAEITSRFDGSRFEASITGAGFEIDVEQRHESTFVAANSTRLLPSQRGSASRDSGTLNNVLRIGEDTYQFRQVQATFDSKTKGNQTSSGLTYVAGAVLKNGEPFGACVLQGQRAVLQTAKGPIPLN